jgi:hypothetical protein
VRRAGLAIRLNDLIIQDIVLIPVVQRDWADGVAHGLDVGEMDMRFWLEFAEAAGG